ncbi:MAG: flagellar biosynthetic protein FliO [Proteobacteria bacterium]|nr:flagellar biosynthetic protein FliO [Pseudomonadota bacterium]MBU4297252.1 flagellar biosynthetic protein FliO [Pseudomonadota bacterium]MCG2747703.1 flagellar biosynthetic protein FliO [Desulfobulbaceae bacterium]
MKGSFLHRSTQQAGQLLRAMLVTLAVSVIPAWAADEPAAKSVTDPVLDLAQTTSLALTIMKVMGSLILTVGIMLLLAIWFRKLGLSRAGLQQGRLISIIDTKMIAPKKYVAVVQVADQTLALGITDQQITILTKLERGATQIQESQEESPQQTSFASLLAKLVKRGSQ